MRIEKYAKQLLIFLFVAIQFSVQGQSTDAEPLTSRESIKINLRHKIDNNIPLIIHVLIPLCDNDNQGIVPTSASLGDGMSLRTNLYWATSSATKKFFQKHSEWNLVYSNLDVNEHVLERVVYERNYKHTKVYLIADAYHGDRMEQTINDFLASLSGHKKEEITINETTKIGISSHADLIIFNGHNGMMDNIEVSDWINNGNKRIDAVINACLSYEYFETELINTNAYPLARTRSLLHPGAYVLTQIIDDWVNMKPEEQICKNAGAAYCKVHDCGKGSRIYKSGWLPLE